MRIAILGGSFDPIHNGHLAAAHSVADTFQVDEVHFVPAFFPPHKQFQGMTSPFHRFAMVALATMPFERFKTSSIEVDTLQKSFTVDTLALMNQRYSGAGLLFVVGTDMYQDIESWKEYRRLFELAHLVIVNRPGFPFREDLAPFQRLAEGDRPALPDQKTVFYLPFVEQPISSTDIRKLGGNAKDCVPPQVWSYIGKNNLYS